MTDKTTTIVPQAHDHMTTDPFEQLLELAKKATPSPWYTLDNEVVTDLRPPGIRRDHYQVCETKRRDDSFYIAHLSPDVVIAFIDALKTCEDAIRRRDVSPSWVRDAEIALQNAREVLK